MHCSICGFENPAGFRFCGQCAAALAEGPGPASPPAKTTPELRPLTVMFCDLVDSTALSEKLDPEELHQLLVDVQTMVGVVVERYGGHVAQYLGDGILVYFGYPRAHEDDARRAVHTALGVVEALAELNERFVSERGFEVHLRLGIHTGEVLTGEVGFGERREILAHGPAPNVAARLQSLARPDTVLLSAATHHLVQGFFEHRPLGAQRLKGVSRPVEIYQVLRESKVSDRFELSVTRGLNPLVGREPELGALWGALEQAEKGRARVALINGEAGLGKSRLIQAFGERVRARAEAFRICRCSPYHLGSALYPIVELLREVFHCPADEPTASALSKLENHLARLGFSLPEAIPLFASLLAIRVADQRYPTPVKISRKKTFKALIALLAALAAERTFVLAVEDLHWVDPSTLEFLDLLVAREQTAALLLLLSFRPTFKPPWTAAAHLCHVEVGRLSRGDTEALASSVTGGRKLPREVLRQIVEKTDGVPLFVEELTKSLLESNLLRPGDGGLELTGPLPRLAIPTTLQGSLAARLDRLGPAKEVAQLAAVAGREFGYAMLSAVYSHGEQSLRLHLARLVDAELLYQRGEVPQAVYTFKHALIQDTAYHSLLRSTRQGYHEKIARLLSERIAELAGSHFELVAHHYEEAGLDEPAIHYLLKAGQSASERAALDEARVHLGRSLALLEKLEGPQRDRLELDLRTTLGPVLVAQLGYAAQEVDDNYKQALRICERVGSDEQLFWVLRGLWTFYIVRAELSQALDLGHRLMQLAEQRGDDTLVFEACHTLALPLFFRGEHRAALDHLERGLALDSPQRDHSLTLVTGLDIAVTSLAISGVILWHLGSPQRALRRCQEAITLARRIAHSYSLADALSSAIWLLQIRGDHELLRESAEELGALAQKNGFNLTAHADLQLGWLAVCGGEPAAGAGRIRRAIDAYRSNGAKVSQPYMLSLLAEAWLAHGDPGQAGLALDEAFSSIAGAGEDFYWLPELHRLRAALHLAKGDSGEGRGAEEALERAIGMARSQDAIALVLRAALDLGRLWARQGKPRPARDLVAAAVDGYFERVPAVWHKEILWAMSRGVHVLGSASMGALRAVELESFGMEAVGEVAAAFRRGELEDDDEVAVVHGPAEAGYRALSEAMVNLRFTLRAAEREGILGRTTHEALVRIAKELFYPERNYTRILARGREDGLPAAELEALEAWLPQGRIDQKRLDALAMLRRMRDLQASEPGPKSVRYCFQHTETWNELLRETGRRASDGDAGTGSYRDQALLEELRLRGAPYPLVRAQAMVRTLALEIAHQQGMKVDEPLLMETAAGFRRRRGLDEAHEAKRWLADQDLEPKAFARLMRDEALINRICSLHAGEAEERELHDHLRVVGQYRELAAGARHKQRTLVRHGLENPGLEDVGVTEAELWRWYFEQHLAQPLPEDLAAYARQLDFANVEALRAAVVRELCFQRLCSRQQLRNPRNS